MPDRFITWRDILRDFVRECGQTPIENQAVVIRDALGLVAFTDQHRRQKLEPEVEAMLAAGAYESAALKLLTPGAGIMLSRGSGDCIATIVLKGSDQEYTASCKTIALALLQAHALALLDEAEQAPSEV